MGQVNLHQYYITAEVMSVLRVSRAAVPKIASHNNWKVHRIGNGVANLYPKFNVLECRAHQLRTRLVKQLGWSGKGLYRNVDIDIECPECEAFAIEWPPAPELPNKYLCLEGHEGKI